MIRTWLFIVTGLIGVGCGPGSIGGFEGFSDGAGDDLVEDSGDDFTDGEAPPDPVEPEPRVGVDPIPVHQPAPGRSLAAAFDGAQYLIAWEDHRAGRPILYGARVRADGSTRDRMGFRILDALPDSDAHVYDYEPVVAFDGTNFLVAVEVAEQIVAVRVARSGEVLDPEGIDIAFAAAPSRPSLVFDGQRYLVAWSGGGVHRAWVEPDGTVIDWGGVLVHAGEDHGVSFDGVHHLLSWTTIDAETQIQTHVLDASRITMAGMSVDPSPIRINPSGTSVGSYQAGFDGVNHVRVWFGAGRIWASRVTPEGTLLDPGGLVVAEPNGPSWLSMASGGGRSIVVWTETQSDTIRATEIASDGTIDPHPGDAFGEGIGAAAALHPNGGLVLWREDTGMSAESFPILGKRLDPAGEVLPGSVVRPASIANHQDVKSVASDGTHFFVVWTDSRDPSGDGKALYGVRVGADGAPLDPEPLRLTQAPAESAQVVFDGTNYVVVWVEDRVELVRVTPAGQRLDLVPVQAPLCRNVDAASDGTHTLLIGRRCEGSELAAVLVDSEAATIGNIIEVGGASVGAVVSSDSLGYLVVRHEPGGLSAQRINPAGLLEGEPFSVVSGKAVRHVSIAGGDLHHLVVWQDDGGIWATRVRPDGQVLDPDGRLVVAAQSVWCGWDPGLATKHCTSAVFDGQNFVVAWRSPTNLLAAEVSPEAEVSSLFAISQEPEREGPPALAAGDAGVLAAYTRFVPGEPYEARRAVARLVRP